jgi:hypothetical protein
MKCTLSALCGCALILCGCSTVQHPPPGQLAVRITTLLGLQASHHDFRIQVDGRFVGNYDPEGTVLELPAGVHHVAVQLPSAAQVRRFPDGSTEVRTFALRGEERVEVLGGSSKQSLTFNDENLKSREVKDADDR